MKISSHFLLEDFNCKDEHRTPYPEEWIESRLIPLCKDLETIRAACDYTPLIVHCGYRTQAYNREIYNQMGKPPTSHSPHCEGLAVDFHSLKFSAQGLYEIVLGLIRAGSIKDGGVGLYHWGVHYDHAGVGRRWNG